MQYSTGGCEVSPWEQQRSENPYFVCYVDLRVDSMKHQLNISGKHLPTELEAN